MIPWIGKLSYLFVLDICAQEEGVNITANSVHPGVIMTPLMRHSSHLMRMLILLKHTNKTTQVHDALLKVTPL